MSFNDLSLLGYVFFLSFIFLIVVVMMNLLNGLAVSDTGVIKEEAEMNSYATQVEVISYVESMLLGDPFNFLSNWPAFVWLRRVPSCSLGSTLYRVPPLRYIFHKITGAPKVLLFYGYLPDKRVTFYPNDQPAYCGCLGGGAVDDDVRRTANVPRFPKEILDSVKASVLEKERAKDSLEERLARAEESNKELASEVGKLSEAVMNLAKERKRF